jgi:TrpR family trp operon transcriptional repressor
MPKASKQNAPSSAAINQMTDTNLAELSAVFARTDSAEETASYFRVLFTPKEIADIARRWALVKALAEKVPQREIAKRFGISLCKITRGSRELKKENSAFVRMLTVHASGRKTDS